jgi:hypothetical protein
MQKNREIKWVLIAIVTVILSACGGGGGGSSGDTSQGSSWDAMKWDQGIWK